MKIKVELVDQHFKDLRDQSHFDARIAYQIDGVRFIFMGFLQSELVDNRRLWNNHRIREVQNSDCRPPRLSALFFTHSRCTKLALM